MTPVHRALWVETMENLCFYGMYIQMGLDLGDPPGVWGLSRGASGQGSSGYNVFGLVVYDE